MDLKDVIEFLQATLRSLGAEVTSPWFYLQFGLILAAFGIAYAADAAIRARVDMSSVAMKWPLPLRRLAHVLVGSASTVVFAILVIAARDHHVPFDLAEPQLPARVAAKLALAWLVIRLITSVIRNAFIVRVVSISAWLIAALSILGQLGPTVDLLELRPVVDRARRAAADAAGADQARRAADRGAVADQHRQQFRREPDQSLHRPDAVDPGAAGQDDPDGTDGGRGDRSRSAPSASTCRRSRYSPARSASVSVSACRRSSPISSRASSCWRTNP